MRTLVTDIAPDSRVLAAMNEINAARRQREAAVNKAEADKLFMIKKAEGEAETKYLLGVGTAKMREAITSGCSIPLIVLFSKPHALKLST